MRSQAGAWKIYDEWIKDGGASFLEEPASVQEKFRSFTQSKSMAPKGWADSYLAAFAAASDLTLVTFDQGFHGRVKHLLVLKP